MRRIQSQANLASKQKVHSSWVEIKDFSVEDSPKIANKSEIFARIERRKQFTQNEVSLANMSPMIIRKTRERLASRPNIELNTSLGDYSEEIKQF